MDNKNKDKEKKMKYTETKEYKKLYDLIDEYMMSDERDDCLFYLEEIINKVKGGKVK